MGCQQWVCGLGRLTTSTDNSSSSTGNEASLCDVHWAQDKFRQLDGPGGGAAFGNGMCRQDVRLVALDNL